MLERVAVHQTRLRTPGLGLDAKGVALGSKGLALLPSMDRLVAFFALYTRQGSLADILRSLVVEVVKSKLGAREVTLTFSAESSDRMDRVAEIVRLAGGYTFTGTSRHFVQYRDAAAPFGYDVPQILHADSVLSLYHSAFTQAYDIERKIDVRQLLLRLSPHPDPSTANEPGPRFIVAESGLGHALIHYFVRSGVDAEVGVAEWPPESSFDEAPIVRYLFQVPEIPPRMVPLLTRTPGVGVFLPVAPGAAVISGYRHPVNLRACPVFGDPGLVLFRTPSEDPLELPEVPAFGDVRAFARIESRAQALRAQGTRDPKKLVAISLPLRLVPSTEPWRAVTATWVRGPDVDLLRQVAYSLGPDTLRRARVAFTEEGIFVRHATGIEGIPVGEFFREIHPGLLIPAGYDALPAVAPEVLHRAFGAPAGQTLFLGRDGRALSVPNEAFVSLEVALLEAQLWAPAKAVSTGVTAALATELPEVFLTSPGMRPMRDVASVPDVGATGRASAPYAPNPTKGTGEG